MRMSQLRKEHPRQKKQQVSATTQGWEGPGISEKSSVAGNAKGKNGMK
jgi:hypothetical protein